MSEIARQWGYLVTWLPSRTVEPGQTGRFDGMQVDVDGHLRDQRIEFAISRDDSTTNLEYRSAKAVSVGWSASASTATGERAELDISFSRESAVVLDVHHAVEHRIDDLGRIKRRILELDRRSGWDKGRAVVVSVVWAERATVMIASARDAAVRCEAKVGEGLGNLADPRLELRLTAEKSMHTTIVSAGHLTPMYQAMILRRGLTGARSLQSALRGAESMDASDPLRDAFDDDFALCAVAADVDVTAPAES
jgi:hypothetical protein